MDVVGPIDRNLPHVTCRLLSIILLIQPSDGLQFIN